MRPKCTVFDEGGRLSIGNFSSVKDERSVTKGEVLAMQLRPIPPYCSRRIMADQR
jgi:serine/threonine-protein kinase HipA